MTDVLLTHSFHLAHDAKQSRKMQPYPPLGTLYAASSLRSAGMQVAVFDTTFVDPVLGFSAALQHHRPRIVAIYEDDFNFVSKMCLSHMRTLGQQLSGVAEEFGAIVVVHGSDATDHPGEYFTAGADFILSGEAEQTLAELCSRLIHSRATEDIPGLLNAGMFASGRTSVTTPPRNPSWIHLPSAARDLIDLEPYERAWTKAHGYFSTNVVSSRGCPYRCNWCAKPISGDKFNLRNASEVAEEIHQLRSRYRVQHIWFGDDVFALNRHWVKLFADATEAYGGKPVPFKIQSRADLMTEATVADLKRAGCVEVWMGVESGSQKILDAMSKGLRLADIHAARSRLASAGIRACYFLQFGYPGEGWNEICETVELVHETRPDDIGVSLSYPLPGTAFHRQVQAQLGDKRNWNDSDDLCAIFTATYTDAFYHTLRDYLHAEVAGWRADNSHTELSHVASWARLVAMEPFSRNKEPLTVSTVPLPRGVFIPLEDLQQSARRA